MLDQVDSNLYRYRSCSEMKTVFQRANDRSPLRVATLKLFPSGKRNREATSLPRLARHADLTAVILRDRLGNG